jgi:asparagine synthase (glutamine-hydrolysing)
LFFIGFKKVKVMVDFRINLLGNQWYHTQNISVVGAGFVGENLRSGGSLAAYFEEIKSWSEFIEKVKGLNGFFAVVARYGNECYASVDRVRSIPLFWSLKDNEFLLSDDPQWIQACIPGESRDPVSLIEFLLTGYVTGSYTLDRRIRQIQAGEAVRVCKENTGLVVQPARYYQFVTGSGEGNNISKGGLLWKFDEIALAAIERLIKIADGRPIVIPLSGGLDSRLIAMSLKRLRYKNILAFSYGVKANWESQTSQNVACQLGIPWHFVEYSRDLWKRWYRSDECQAYIRYAGKIVSLAHLQDWPAVMELKKRGVIPGEALIIPGHSGDFLAGTHIPLEIANGTRCDIHKVIRAIWQHHYILMPSRLAFRYAGTDDQEMYRGVLERLELYFGQTGVLEIPRAIGLYEMWDWAERQAKYIVNSVRVYDFFGLDWSLPWWDAEVMSFWECVPLRSRVGEKLYKEYVEFIQDKMGIKIGVSIGARGKMILKKLDKAGLLKKVYTAVQKPRGPASVILALDGAFDLISEREMSVLGAAALAQIRQLLPAGCLSPIPDD